MITAVIPLKQMMHYPSIFFIFLTLAFGLGASDSWPAKGSTDPLPATNQKLVEFCKKNVGKSVARGYCSELAVEAMKYAGIDTSHYGWGRRLNENETWMAGDILQFVEIELNDTEFCCLYILHTAIVAEVADDYVVIFEQSTSTDKRVVKHKISKNAEWSKLPWAFRPVASECWRGGSANFIRSRVRSSGILERYSILQLEELP